MIYKLPAAIQNFDNSFFLNLTKGNLDPVEAHKLYIDGSLRKFYPGPKNPGCIWLKYESAHGLHGLAECLFRGCFDSFNENVEIEREMSPGANRQVVSELQMKEQENG